MLRREKQKIYDVSYIRKMEEGGARRMESGIYRDDREGLKGIAEHLPLESEMTESATATAVPYLIGLPHYLTLHP